MKRWACLCALLLAIQLPAYAADYYNDHAVGWHWYHDAPQQSPRPRQAALFPKIDAPLMDPDHTMKTVQHRVHTALNQAILQPTPVHLRQYIALQNALSAQASRFSTAWQALLWQFPELHYGLAHPTSGLAKSLQQKHLNKVNEQQLRAFFQHHGLFFFYKASCPYCQRFAPILKAFAKHYGITIIPITLDKKSLADFPQSHLDQGQARRFGVYQTPALFIVNPKTKAVIPVGYGLMSWQQLTQRLVTVITQLHHPAKSSETNEHRHG